MHRGSDHFQTPQTQLMHRLLARLGFILDVYGNFRRQPTELIADVPAALAAI